MPGNLGQNLSSFITLRSDAKTSLNGTSLYDEKDVDEHESGYATLEDQRGVVYNVHNSEIEKLENDHGNSSKLFHTCAKRVNVLHAAASESPQMTELPKRNFRSPEKVMSSHNVALKKECRSPEKVTSSGNVASKRDCRAPERGPSLCNVVVGRSCTSDEKQDGEAEQPDDFLILKITCTMKLGRSLSSRAVNKPAKFPDVGVNDVVTSFTKYDVTNECMNDSSRVPELGHDIRRLINLTVGTESCTCANLFEICVVGDKITNRVCGSSIHFNNNNCKHPTMFACNRDALIAGQTKKAMLANDFSTLNGKHYKDICITGEVGTIAMHQTNLDDNVLIHKPLSATRNIRDESFSSNLDWYLSSPEAHQNAFIEAQQSGTLDVQQKVSLVAQQSASLKVPQCASLVAQQSVSIEAQYNALLEAQHNASLEVQQNVSLKSQQNASIEAPQSALREVLESASLEAPQCVSLGVQQSASIEALQNVSLEDQQNASQAAQNLASLDLTERNIANKSTNPKIVPKKGSSLRNSNPFDRVICTKHRLPEHDHNKCVTKPPRDIVLQRSTSARTNKESTRERELGSLWDQTTTHMSWKEVLDEARRLGFPFNRHRVHSSSRFPTEMICSSTSGSQWYSSDRDQPEKLTCINKPISTCNRKKTDEKPSPKGSIKGWLQEHVNQKDTPAEPSPRGSIKGWLQENSDRKDTSDEPPPRGPIKGFLEEHTHKKDTPEEPSHRGSIKAWLQGHTSDLSRVQNVLK